MKKFELIFRRKFKKTISMVLSCVLVMGVICLPTGTQAAAGTPSGNVYTLSNESPFSSGMFIFPGDVIRAESFVSGGVNYDSEFAVSYKTLVPESSYTGLGTIEGDFNIPATMSGFEYNSNIYYTGAGYVIETSPAPHYFWTVTLDAYPGFQVFYHDEDGNVINGRGSQIFFLAMNEDHDVGVNTNTADDLDISPAYDETLGEQIGWCTNPDYIDREKNSSDVFVTSEEGPVLLFEDELFKACMDKVSDGALNLYPIFAHLPSTLSVTVDDVIEGNEIEVSVESNRTDTYKVVYASKNSDGTFTELSAAPKTPGNYRATVVFPETDTQLVEGVYGSMEVFERGFTGISASDEFSIITDTVLTEEPAANTLTYNGEEQTLITSGSVSGGELFYSLDGSSYSSAIPSAKDAGKYTVWYMVKGTDGRSDISPASIDVTISPKTVGLSWSGTKYEYDGASHCPSATATGLLDGDSCDVTVTGAQKEAGTYTATASALSNSNYALPNANTTQFIITKDGEVIDQDKLKGSVNVSMEGFYYGGKQTSPVITSTTNDVKGAKVSYKAAGSADSTYSPSVPTEAGKYIVKVTLPANDKYNACSATAEFSISYLPVPDNAYYIRGTKGADNWYKSEVSITPGAGYQLSYGDRNHFSNNGVKIEKSVNQVFIYVRDASTYEQTDVITIAGFKIDTKSPKVEDMESGEVYFADESGNVTCVVSDENLSHVVIDGNKVKLNDLGNGRKSFEIPVGAKKETVSFTAYDLAGNKTEFDVTTAPSWKRNGVISEGEIYLEAGEKFTIPEGKWIVDGDSTVYLGGSVFYAVKEGMYTFKKQ
ncbi:hypothetical protein SAMN04487760_11259 [Lachnospiraceae bacterium G41]|nr:hypothetical protein SAMN04487760_11259 [Lachnospiraceae bacterium G41]